MTRCPFGRPPKHAPPPCWPAEIWLSHLSPGRQARLWVNRAQRAFCYSPNREAGKTSQGGGRGGRRLAPLTPPLAPPQYLGEAVPPRLSQGRGKGHPQEAGGRHWVTGLVLGVLWACESAPRSAPWGLLCSQSRRGGEGPLWCTRPTPAPAQALPWRSPHPAGESRQLRAGGHHLAPRTLRRRAHPHFPGKEEGSRPGWEGGGNKFQFRTPPCGLGLPNRLVLMLLVHTCKGTGGLRWGGRRVTGEGHPPGASRNGSPRQVLRGSRPGLRLRPSPHPTRLACY